MTDPPHVNYTWSIQESVGAGIDMVMVGYNYFEFIDGLTYLVNNNYIPVSRIDVAVKRILRVKFVMGLFENPLTDLSMGNTLENRLRPRTGYQTGGAGFEPNRAGSKILGIESKERIVVCFLVFRDLI
ncbi:putative glucan 1,3-beta-glucosidase [Helianthus annuus]|nr:putative glucan 1,3-beta-glucosidase [Helianthus annuus]KAJ0897156.1 putative glucan 1,3-beta-glucosidase [Helianthus annuus]